MLHNNAIGLHFLSFPTRINRQAGCRGTFPQQLNKNGCRARVCHHHAGWSKLHDGSVFPGQTPPRLLVSDREAWITSCRSLCEHLNIRGGCLFVLLLHFRFIDYYRIPNLTTCTQKTSPSKENKNQTKTPGVSPREGRK